MSPIAYTVTSKSIVRETPHGVHETFATAKAFADKAVCGTTWTTVSVCQHGGDEEAHDVYSISSDEAGVTTVDFDTGSQPASQSAISWSGPRSRPSGLAERALQAT